MSRIRSVHPGLWTDDEFVSMSLAARLFLIGIWNEADDFGLFEWKPLRLKMRLAPADNIDAAAILAELVESGFLVLLSRNGKDYGAVKNFRKFQRPQKPGSPVVPLDDEITRIVALVDAPSVDDRDTPAHEPLREDPRPLHDHSGSGTVIAPQMERCKGIGKGEEQKERSLRSLGAAAPDPEADAELERTYRALAAAEPRKPSRPKVRSTISEDAQPSERDAAAAREAGLSDNDFRTQWRQFRDHHRAKGSLMSDWSAAWRTWIGNINKFAGTGPPNTRFGTRNGKPSISDFVRAYDDRVNATDAADRGVQGGEIRALPSRQLSAF